MAWIESHQTLAHHPKMQQLALLLGVSEPAAIGHLHLLWWWCLDYAQDGDITRFAPEVIARAAQWKGKSAKFLDALLDCGPAGGAGFLERTADNGIRIHDWEEFAGRLILRRREDTERKRETRKSSVLRTSGGHPADIPATSDRHPADVQSSQESCPTDVCRTLPNPTVPNQKQAGARAHTREEPAGDPPPTTPACPHADEVVDSPSSNGRTPLPINGLKPWRERLADEPEHWTPEEIRTVETVVTRIRGDDEPKQPLRYYLPLLHDLRAGRMDAGQVEAARDYLASRERMGLR